MAADAPAGEQWADALLSKLEEAVDAQDGLASAMSGADPSAPLKIALEKASLELSRLDFAAARALLVDALQAGEAITTGFDRAGLEEAQRLLGLSDFRAGHTDAAARELVELYRLFPETTAGAGAYPASFLNALRRAQSRVRALPTAALSVEGPEGAALILDGRNAGDLPWHGNLSVGIHLLELAATDGHVSERVTVVPLQTTTVRLNQASAAPSAVREPGLSGPRLGAEEVALLRRLCQAQGAAYAILGYVKFAPSGEGEWWPSAFSAAAGGFFALPFQKLTSRERRVVQAQAVAQAFAASLSGTHGSPSVPFDLSGLASSATAAAPTPAWAPTAPGVASAPSSTSVAPTKRWPWWVWVAGGVALAGAGAGTYAVLSSGHSSGGGTVSATW